MVASGNHKSVYEKIFRVFSSICILITGFIVPAQAVVTTEYKNGFRYITAESEAEVDWSLLDERTVINVIHPSNQSGAARNENSGIEPYTTGQMPLDSWNVVTNGVYSDLCHWGYGTYFSDYHFTGARKYFVSIYNQDNPTSVPYDIRKWASGTKLYHDTVPAYGNKYRTISIDSVSSSWYCEFRKTEISGGDIILEVEKSPLDT